MQGSVVICLGASIATSIWRGKASTRSCFDSRARGESIKLLRKDYWTSETDTM